MLDKVIFGLRKVSIRELTSQLALLLKQPVFRNIVLVAFITFFVKALGFYKESVVAAEFGLSQQLDTFFIAMLIPGFITTVFLGSFNSVFIPNYISELRTGNKMDSFQTMGFLVVLGVSIIFLLFSILVTDTYLKYFFSGHTEEYYQAIKLQFYYLAPCIILWGLSAFISGLLNINNEFKYSSLNTIFIPIVIIICIFFFKDFMGKTVLALGTLIGSFLNLLFLLVVAFNAKIISFGKPDFRNSNVILMLKQVPAKASSGFLTGLMGITNQYFAAKLAIGSISAINYGIKIPAFITGILILAMNSVLLPHFSKRVVDNRKKAFDDLFKLIKWLFIASSLVAIIAIMLSDFMVPLIFERNEFTSEDSRVVSLIQKIALIYAPFTICEMVLVNFLTSINKNSLMAWISLGSFLANIILGYLGMVYYGIYGITIATTTIYILRSIAYLNFTIRQKKLTFTDQV